MKYREQAVIAVLLFGLGCRVGPKEETGGGSGGEDDTGKAEDSDSGEADTDTDSDTDTDTDTDSDSDSDTDTDADSDTDSDIDTYSEYIMLDGTFQQKSQYSDAPSGPWVDICVNTYALVEAIAQDDCAECDFAFWTQWDHSYSDPPDCAPSRTSWSEGFGFDIDASADESVYVKISDWPWVLNDYTGYLEDGLFSFYTEWDTDPVDDTYPYRKNRFEAEIAIQEIEK